MKSLNILSAIYVLSASAFGIAIAIQRNPDVAEAANRAGQAVWPAIERSAGIVDENAVQPALQSLVEAEALFFGAFDPPRISVAASTPARNAIGKISPNVVAAHQAKRRARKFAAPPPLRPTIAETESPQIARVDTAKPDLTLVPNRTNATTASASRRNLYASSAGNISRVMRRLKNNLTTEMLQNFKLFLYVSKADHGPWAQRMYVFRKRANGNLNLLYNWPVSTGREMVEFAPNGQRAPSFTPKGYYELDPGRMYKHHTSGQWGTPMPYAMFFNWENNGLRTGLAIHGATGSDAALLGRRASAGCVRLAPENAALLFNLIRANYKGLAPRFAFDRRTASMSNDGFLMRDAQGRVKFAEGYEVLVFIEDYGGNNVVAAVF